jgi:hypothetical protein
MLLLAVNVMSKRLSNCHCSESRCGSSIYTSEALHGFTFCRTCQDGILQISILSYIVSILAYHLFLGLFQ